MINTILRMLGYFDSNGLHYSVGHLKRMRNLIPFWSRDKQALYVDQVTKENLNTGNKIDKSVCQQIAEMSSSNWYASDMWNTTSVGNLAYISIYCNNKDVRRHAEDCLRNLQKAAAENRKGGDIYYM